MKTGKLGNRKLKDKAPTPQQGVPSWNLGGEGEREDPRPFQKIKPKLRSLGIKVFTIGAKSSHVGLISKRALFLSYSTSPFNPLANIY